MASSKCQTENVPDIAMMTIDCRIQPKPFRAVTQDGGSRSRPRWLRVRHADTFSNRIVTGFFAITIPVWTAVCTARGAVIGYRQGILPHVHTAGHPGEQSRG